MSLKPICVDCQRFYRPERNGINLIENKPVGGLHAPPGNTAPELWEPYKLWKADLWKCHGCGHLLIIGSGHRQISEHYMPDWEQKLEENPPMMEVNDC
ncbi:MAG TPA: hypothetical protein VH593_08100 [Ktedonobacteraceae bacterium]|jgi:hypothetical protein